MLAPTLMVQGTASSVGKSLLVTALCRFFYREGIRVVPFKSQNMALSSAVTPDGLEIGRAQAVQAEAAGLAPSVEMNPILLKPEGARGCQVVVMGKPIGSMSSEEYYAYRPHLHRAISSSLATLRESYELVLIEGAGSPAEINLKDRDIANMYVARMADAPVILVGDIDRGGVFASLVGTMELLEPDERERVAALVINKFRGDVTLLEPGLDLLSQRTGKAVLGVVPYVSDLRIADEDSVSIDHRMARPRPDRDQLDIAVIRLPRISNHDDVLPLEHEAGVVVRFVEHAQDLEQADLVILPGSKNTASDLGWLRQRGIAQAIVSRGRRGAPVLGICGGCQMLGQAIEDPHHVESEHDLVDGLGLLPLRTRFGRHKTTARIRGRVRDSCFLTSGVPADEEISGYEIHMGTANPMARAASPFEICSRNGNPAGALDGALSESGTVVGTMIHGLFENSSVRSSLLSALRQLKGISPPARAGEIPQAHAEYDRLEAAARSSLDLELLWHISGLRAARS